MANRDVAKLLHEREIDIAVDVMGYTKDARPGILSHRPAPIQVNYLGYPGTMGADFIDYIMADAVVLPPAADAFHAEKVVRLPDCYQVTDRERPIAETVPSRKDAGLPEQGFVFCSFNNTYKITAAMFDVRMGMLAEFERRVDNNKTDNMKVKIALKRLNALNSSSPRRRPARPGLRVRCAVSRPAASSLRRACGRPSTSRAIASPISSSIRCPIMPTPPAAMHCGPACRSSPAAARVLRGESRQACCKRSGCRNSSPRALPITRRWRDG
jgi:hypothetical protein